MGHTPNAAVQATGRRGRRTGHKFQASFVCIVNSRSVSVSKNNE